MLKPERGGIIPEDIFSSLTVIEIDLNSRIVEIMSDVMIMAGE